VGREVDQGQVPGDLEAGADVPAGPVENEHGVRTGRDRLRHFGQEQAHGEGRGLGQDQRHAGIPLWADRAEEVDGGPTPSGRPLGDPGEALLAHAARAHAFLVPDVGRAPFLADPGPSLPSGPRSGTGGSSNHRSIRAASGCWAAISSIRAGRPF
jgi:hypothetical protein